MSLGIIISSSRRFEYRMETDIMNQNVNIFAPFNDMDALLSTKIREYLELGRRGRLRYVDRLRRPRWRK